jgi:undecaprenyl-diphosphatase
MTQERIESIEERDDRRSFWREGAVLLVIILLTGAVWVFLELADEVIEKETHGFDEQILLAMRDRANPADPWGPAWLEEMGRDFTALGGVGVLVLLTLATAGGYLLGGHPRMALLVLLAVFGGFAVAMLLKAGFSRPRPDLVPHGSYVYTASFPSGHSMLSAITYLTLGFLLARTHERRRTKLYIMGVTLLVTGLVGISRVYLGVHWPTDVLAGWAAGAAWALLWWLIVRWFQHHRNI